MSNTLGTTSTQSLRSTPNSILTMGAKQIAERISRREISTCEVVEQFIKRIECVDQRLNAVVIRCFDQARQAAAAADKLQAEGRPLGPLHGVPVTIKECFYVRGTPATIGLPSLSQDISDRDALLVQRLQHAGAIVLGKTNVPQAMFFIETDNPVYGPTKNPWNLKRTPGGSSGGEAAIIAAGGSPLGLGSDLGGSIRIPCHFCGIHGLKPTSRRLSTEGLTTNLQGMNAVTFQPGPMSRRVEDIALAMEILSGNDNSTLVARKHKPPLLDYRNVSLSSLRIGVWLDETCFPLGTAVKRVVEEAAEYLREGGAEVFPFLPPRAREAAHLFCGVISADGTANLRRLVSGNPVDRRLRKMLTLGRLPRVSRPPLAAMLRLLGQSQTADMIMATGPRSVDSYWQMCHQLSLYNAEFHKSVDEQRIDAFICPPFPTPAFSHGRCSEFCQAASYSLVPNLIGLPAGVVAAGRVQEDETNGFPKSRDRTIRSAAAAMRKGGGLPIGVQVAAKMWREDVVLAVMSAIENAFQNRKEYPANKLPDLG